MLINIGSRPVVCSIRSTRLKPDGESKLFKNLRQAYKSKEEVIKPSEVRVVENYDVLQMEALSIRDNGTDARGT